MSRKYYKTENRQKFFKEQSEKQEGRCAICNKEERLVVDHCHKTGLMRGLLCYKHNSALGYFDDSADILQAAVNYLRNNEPKILLDGRKTIRNAKSKEIIEVAKILIEDCRYNSDRARARALATLVNISEEAAQSRICRVRQSSTLRQE